jgi:hypothetical protein
MVGAVSRFTEEVRAWRFPDEAHCSAMELGEREQFLASLEADV